MILSLVLGMFVFENKGSDFDYKKAWQEVETLIKDRLPQSALERVEIILENAKKEDRINHKLKAIKYISKLNVELNEEGIVMSIDRLNKEIQLSKNEDKNVLTSYLAELLHNYFNQNRWNISQRTHIDGNLSKDVKTWSSRNFIENIGTLYLSSIENPEKLQKPIKNYLLLLNKDVKGEIYRPTLYYLLVDRCFRYFSQYHTDLPRSIDAFYIDKPEYLTKRNLFRELEIVSNDKLSFDYQLLKLYQQVISIASTSNDFTALLDYDLKRLKFVATKGAFDKKDSIYLKSLEDLIEQTDDDIAYKAQILYEKAVKMSQLASSDSELREVVGLCDKVINQYGDELGGRNCKSLKQRLVAKELNIVLDEYHPTNRGILCQLKYKNISDLFVRIIPAEGLKEKLDRKDKVSINKILRKQEAIRYENLTLEDTVRLVTRNSEIILEPLPIGDYILLCSPNADFKHDFTYHYFSVSDLSLLTHDEGNKKVFVVMDRKSGKAISGVQADVFMHYWDRNERKRKQITSGSFHTDNRGIFYLTKSDQNKHVTIELKNGDDRFTSPHQIYLGADYDKKERKVAEVFLDRAIYRPGQTLHFKSIVMAYSIEEIPRIITKEPIEVALYDANGQEVSRFKTETNDFGSIHSSFIIPNSGLNGNYSLRLKGNDINAYKQVRVEEYKRPNFKVEITKPENQYVIGDSVATKIKASNYAGVALDGAKFRYKITRGVSFPYWPWYRRITPVSNTTIIDLGNGELNDKGEYEILFLAADDPLQNKTNNPRFDYFIEVDVTDINGETQSSSIHVLAQHKGFSLSYNLKGEIDKSDLDSLVVEAKLISGSTIGVRGSLQIIKLQEPKRVLLKKKIDIVPLLNRSDKYRTWLPGYTPTYSADLETWPEDKQVYQGVFDSGKNAFSSWQNLEAGVYKIFTQSKDNYGNDVEFTDYIVLTDFDKKTFPKADYLFTQLNKSTYQPGDLFELDLGSPKENIHAYILKGNVTGVTPLGWFEINNSNNYSFTISDQDLGGFYLNILFVKENQIIEKRIMVNVPWKSKDLNVTFETFRDILEPGEKEEWKIKISGKKSDIVLYEILASMYDASLDAFTLDNWSKKFYPNRAIILHVMALGFNNSGGRNYIHNFFEPIENIQIPHLLGLEANMHRRYYAKAMSRGGRPEMMEMGAPMMDGVRESASNAVQIDGVKVEDDEIYHIDANADNQKTAKKEEEIVPKLRKNLDELVFFYPRLKTDEEGNFVISFTMNEALTEWKFRLLAHSKELASAYAERIIKTQKEIMVLPNLPRFLRQMDRIQISTKIANLLKEDIAGTAKIKLFNALNGNEVTNLFIKKDTEQRINLTKEDNENVSWWLDVPNVAYPVKYQIFASTANHSDGQEGILPLVTNRTLVTETMPIQIRGGETKEVNFKALKNNNSKTKIDHLYRVDIVSNPLWYAIQSLPYLMEYPYECTEQLINRLYANRLASEIANKHPKIKSVFDQWKGSETALLSNLNKNEALKSAIIEETPWVRDAMSEEEQKRNIALLFDMNKMSSELSSTLQKIKERQYSNGGFPWFNGGRAHDYISQYVIESLGHMKQLDLLDEENSDLDWMHKAISFIDLRVKERYEELLEHIERHGGDINADHLNSLDIHYLYCRSFFTELPIPNNSMTAFNYYQEQAKKYWKRKTIYQTALLGMSLYRWDNSFDVFAITESLKQRSLFNEELGVYWNEGNGYYWDQLPIEKHATALELFVETEYDEGLVEELKRWLLNNKRTNRWKTTKGTAAAIYTLLLSGEKGINEALIDSEPLIVSANNKRIEKVESIEAGTGYYTIIDQRGDKVETSDGDLEIENPNESTAWVSAYYQYFENLDKIKSDNENPFSITKEYYHKVEGKNGSKLVEISSAKPLQVGDKVVVRMVVRSNREMEFVHLKDMRPSCLEPKNVFSGYRWQGTLGYYETTKDLGTHFFIDHLSKGTHILEYETVVAHKGDFSTGIANLQCMYAPEFNSHSQGIKLSVK